MAVLTRQLYCHFFRGMISVCDSPANCHIVASQEFGEEESTDDKVKNSSPNGLQLNMENQTRESRDGEILGGEKTFIKGKHSDNICESSDDEKTLRRKYKTENKRYISKNHNMDDAKSVHKKHVQINKKQTKPALGSGKRFGVQYSNQKYPIMGEILFGYHPVSIALSHRRRHCYKLFIQQRHKLSLDVDILGLAEDANIPVEEVSRIHLDQLCLGRPHQGICMDVDPIDIPNLSPDDLRTAVVDPPPIWLLPFEVVDPMNMGAIIRSSYYFGVDTMVLPSKHCATASPMVSKASSGAMELMKFFYLKNNTATLQFLQDWKTNVGQVIGTATGPDTVAVEDCLVTTPTLLIVGNEHRGLKNGILEHCTQIVKLPEFSPHKQSLIGSLNVSVATGIVLHALRTNRTIK